jgi:hypothetical protein
MLVVVGRYCRVNVVDIASTALSRRSNRALRAKRRPALLLSVLDSPISLPRRREAQAPVRKPAKLMSLELDLGGFAVEFKAKNLAGLLTWLSIDIAVAAVVQELMRPRQFRTWHGRVAGLIPYDFRKPTPRRVLSALWAPGNPRLFTDTAFGVGWGINLAQLPHALSGASRPMRARHYEGPKVTATR